MTTSLTRARLACLCAALSLLTGCSLLSKIRGEANSDRATAAPAKTTPKAAAKPAIDAPPRAAAATAANIKRDPLSDGIALYDAGDYNGAIKRLASAHEIWSGDKATKTTALKYMAFSYCVTGRRVLCKRQFDKALKLDPSFDLAQGEKGHPLWGPVFDKAKKRK